MAKQWTELEKLVIPKGKRVSNVTSLHPKTGTIATITIYASDRTENAFVCVSADGEKFLAFKHRGQPVKVESGYACDVPLPACKSMRLEAVSDVEEDAVYQVLVLLEVD